MNKVLSNLLLLGVSTLLFSACSLKQMIDLAEQQNLTVTPNPLELHGDSVKVDIGVDLPVDMMKPKTTYTLKLTYKANGQVTDIGDIVLDASDYPKGSKPRINKTFVLPFKEDMVNGEVFWQGTAKKGESTKSTPDAAVIGKGTITTSRLVLPTYYTSYFHSSYVNKDEYLTEKLPSFYFLKGRSNLRQSEKRDKRTTALKDYINEYMVAKDLVTGVTVVGTHSPEGSTEINSELSDARSTIVREYIANLASEQDYKGSKVEYVNKSDKENWSVFQDSLKNYTKVSQVQKDKINSIIDGPGDFISKELALRKLSSYRQVVRDIYPKLRNSSSEVKRKIEKLSDPQIYTLAKQIADKQIPRDTLDNVLLFYAADKLMTTLDEKIKAYKACTEHIKDAESFNNLGACYLEKSFKEIDMSKKNALIAEAEKALKESLGKKETPEALANLAGIQMYRGDLDAAWATVAKISPGNPSENVDKTVKFINGYKAVKEADYGTAVDNLSAAAEDANTYYMRGLAYLLKGSYGVTEENKNNADIQSSIEFFDKAIELNDKHAYAYYGKAIASARLKNEEVLYESLKKAATLDSNLKARAATDMEFWTYFSQEKFKGALQ